MRLQKQAEIKNHKKLEKRNNNKEKRRLKKLQEQLLRFVVNMSETDDAVAVECNKCKSCDEPYEDFVECITVQENVILNVHRMNY